MAASAAQGKCGFLPLKPMLFDDVVGIENMWRPPDAVLTRGFMAVLGWRVLLVFGMAIISCLSVGEW